MATSSQTLTNEEVLERHRASFMEKMAELQVHQGKGSKFLNIQEQEAQIETLVALQEKRKKLTIQDMNLVRKRAVLNIEAQGEVQQRLVKAGTNLRYVPTEEMFDVLSHEHQLTAHGGRDIMHDKLKVKFANVTIAIIKCFVDSCLNCSLKKSRTRKALVVKPIISPRAWHRWQTDLIDMQSQPDDEYKYIMVTQDHFSKFCFLQPLTRKTAEAVAANLSVCFSFLGPPACLLQSDNGREFKNAEVLRMIEETFPGLKMVHGKPRHSQSQGSVERANRDVEAMLATEMADGKTSHWAALLPKIQLKKNSRFHSGIGRSPLQV